MAAHTPGSAGLPSAPGSSPGKKSVRWQLKRNVVNVIGAPPKPQHVRTPPTARPKGPALKRLSTLGGLDLYQTQSAPGRLTRSGATRIEAANGVSRLAHGSGKGDAPARAAANGLGHPHKGSQSVSAKGAHEKKKGQQQRGRDGAGPRRLSLKSPGKLQRPRAADFF